MAGDNRKTRVSPRTAFLRALAAVLILMFWPAASYAGSFSSILALTIPSAVLTGSKAQADAAVIGPQTMQLDTNNIFAASPKIRFVLSVDGANFATSSSITITGASCQSTSVLLTTVIFDGCTVTGTGNAFPISGVSYTSASALAAVGAKINLSGGIYVAGSNIQLESINATQVVANSTAATFSLAVPATLGASRSSTLNVTVTRTGTTTSTANVAYATQNGTAIAGTDYTAASGTLAFSANDTTATIPIPILNNSAQTGTSTFTVTISNPSAGGAITTASVTVTIEALITRQVTTTTTGTGSGTISPSSPTATNGSVVTLTATPASGSVFAGWSGGCTGTSTTCQLTVNANVTVTATFNTAPNAFLRQGAVFSSASGASQSFLRFYNAGTTAGTVTVTLSDYISGQSLGQWTSPSIAPGTAPQYGISTLEAGLTGTKPAFYSVKMQSQFAGTFQHVLWKPSDGTLTNLSTCDSGITGIATRMTNVHSSVLGNAGYPSSIVVYNTGSATAAVALNVSDATTGKSLGTYSIAAIPAEGQQVLTVSSIETTLKITPTSSIPHYTISVQGSFTGYLQHLLTNNKVGIITDMSTVCSLPTPTGTQTAPPTNPSGS